jgi:hypothetical protein
MQSLLEATPASVALAAALSLCPLSLIAQNATSNDAVSPGTTSDPLADDETTPTEETIADPAATVEASRRYHRGRARICSRRSHH